ncbi:MAG TPA: DEAD/DEAH box helicase [Longimicrobiales bacterium]|nr:DEAD/DEAH box helicase [Longimicrobiales bacterium]
MKRTILDFFTPATRHWFDAAFASPNEVQARGWERVHAGEHTLLIAPTGSGKTLAAFLYAMDRLSRPDREGAGEPGVRVVYVSPLKALVYDIERNLRTPLAGGRPGAGPAQGARPRGGRRPSRHPLGAGARAQGRGIRAGLHRIARVLGGELPGRVLDTVALHDRGELPELRGETAARLMRLNLLTRRRASVPVRRRQTPTGQRFWVYGRAGRKCLDCGSRIERFLQGDMGRSTYVCPTCQPPAPAPVRGGGPAGGS